MAKARALDKRRKSIRNIRKITRTMELIATARSRRPWTARTRPRPTPSGSPQLVADLVASGLEVSIRCWQAARQTERAVLLVLTANRGLCGGYNCSVLRAGLRPLPGTASRPCRRSSWKCRASGASPAFRFRGIDADADVHAFRGQAEFAEVEVLANRYLEAYAAGQLDRLDVAYTRFESVSRQNAVVETLLPLGSLAGPRREATAAGSQPARVAVRVSALGREHSGRGRADQLQGEAVQVLPRCGRQRADRPDGGHEGGHGKRQRLIKQLSMAYNRARQSQITGEIMEIIGGVEALK